MGKMPREANYLQGLRAVRYTQPNSMNPFHSPPHHPFPLVLEGFVTYVDKIYFFLIYKKLVSDYY